VPVLFDEIDGSPSVRVRVPAGAGPMDW